MCQLQEDLGPIICSRLNANILMTYHQDNRAEDKNTIFWSHREVERYLLSGVTNSHYDSSAYEKASNAKEYLLPTPLSPKILAGGVQIKL